MKKTIERVVELDIQLMQVLLICFANLEENVIKGHAVWIRINPGFGHGHSQKDQLQVGKIANMVFGMKMCQKH